MVFATFTQSALMVGIIERTVTPASTFATVAQSAFDATAEDATFSRDIRFWIPSEFLPPQT
jgi:hypothetical protein